MDSLKLDFSVEVDEQKRLDKIGAKQDGMGQIEGATLQI